MYVCMYVCVYVCMYVCMYAFVCACMCVMCMDGRTGGRTDIYVERGKEEGRYCNNNPNSVEPLCVVTCNTLQNHTNTPPQSAR